jgi:micrococcal nuclease
MKRLFTALALTIVISGCSTSSPGPDSVGSSVTAPTASAVAVPQNLGEVAPKGQLQGPFPVARVVDGDTIHVGTSQGDLKVRLIGIDTPETVDPNRPVGCFGPEASAEAKRLLEGGSVYLELDPTQGDVDKYGRTLAFVWMDPQTMFNLVMVQEGFAIEYTYDDPYAYQAEFRAAQQQAQAAGLGMWASCPSPQ